LLRFKLNEFKAKIIKDTGITREEFIKALEKA